MHCFLDWSLMESSMEDYIVGASTPNIWPQNLCILLRLFLIFVPLSLTIYPSKSLQLNLYLLLYYLLLYFLPFVSSLCLILVVPSPQLLVPVCLIKCSLGRNKKCEENFIDSAFSSLCSDSLCWWRQDMSFIFPFPFLMFLGSCHHMFIWVFLDQDPVNIAAQLYKISDGFLVN